MTLAIVHMPDGTIRYRSWFSREHFPSCNCPLFKKPVPPPGRAYGPDELCAYGWEYAGYPSGYPTHMMLLPEVAANA